MTPDQIALATPLLLGIAAMLLRPFVIRALHQRPQPRRRQPIPVPLIARTYPAASRSRSAAAHIRHPKPQPIPLLPIALPRKIPTRPYTG